MMSNVKVMTEAPLKETEVILPSLFSSYPIQVTNQLFGATHIQGESSVSPFNHTQNYADLVYLGIYCSSEQSLTITEGMSR